MAKLPKALALAVTLALTATMLLAGCSTTATPTVASTTAPAATTADTATATAAATTEAPPATQGPVVTLNCYYPNSTIPNFDKILDLVNKVTLEKIHANVIMNEIVNNYGQTMSLMVSAGESFDVCFGAYWDSRFGFYDNAAKGAFLPLNDLLDKYAPVSKARVPAIAWPAVTLNGKIYAMPNYQQWGMCNQYGVYLIKKDIVAKYNFDPSKMTSLKDIEPYLAACKKDLPAGVVCFEATNKSLFAQTPMMFGFDAVGDGAIPGWVKLDDSSITVVDQYETPEFKDYVTLMHDWYQKGYIKTDAATMQDASPDRKAGLVCSRMASGFYIPTSAYPHPDLVLKNEDPTASTGKPEAVFTKAYIQASKGAEACSCIGANSKNPERSMQWIELLNTDEDLWALINYGREGIDYQRVDARHIKPDTSSYNFNWNDWTIGQSAGRTMNYYDVSNDADNEDFLRKTCQEADKTATPSPISGFFFNTDPVKTEIANCSTVISEMLASLSAGAIDPATYLPQFISKLKTAGMDTIIAEKQKQLDAWKAANEK